MSTLIEGRTVAEVSHSSGLTRITFTDGNAMVIRGDYFISSTPAPDRLPSLWPDFHRGVAELAASQPDEPEPSKARILHIVTQ